MKFDWNAQKEALNVRKHGVDFYTAQEAFKDPRKVVFQDAAHSVFEKRYYCLGKVEGRILSVRYTIRKNVIRIIGAGYWRKGKKQYEKENRLHR